MSYTDWAEQARQDRRDRDRAYRRAKAAARDAEWYYHLAGEARKLERWLNRHPDLWGYRGGATPANHAANAASWLQLADATLRSSFRATDSARFYGEMMRRSERYAAEQAARLAEYRVQS